jgi:2-oxoglutarate/2-oxoacid ferredoxin oxidoreductase subunit beta
MSSENGNGNGNGGNGGHAGLTVLPPAPALTRKDFVTDQDVRWCPGCGDYAILAQVQKVMPELGVARENIAFVSGIGCSSRFPYYMNTYGFHSIHGRAPAIASGLKVSRPELMVWVVTGDGDGLSIGGNHLIHALRRNVGLKILLFNNRIYGLTKGQYSPTSEIGKKTKSTPYGSIDRPFSPVSVALGAEATFVARSVDTDVQHLQYIIRRAAEHTGTAFIEIYQNCNVFNDDAFVHITEKSVKQDRQIVLEHGKPLLFGKNKEKGIRMAANFTPQVVEVGSGPGQVPLSEITVHDETVDSPAYAFMLSRLDYPDFPVPVGVYRAVKRPAYEDLAAAQMKKAMADRGLGDVDKLLRSGEIWTVPSVTPGSQ